MKTFLMVIIVTTLTGCIGIYRMGNDEIIAESMKCDQAGLQWRQVLNHDGSVKSVHCASPLMRRDSQGATLR